MRRPTAVALVASIALCLGTAWVGLSAATVAAQTETTTVQTTTVQTTSTLPTDNRELGNSITRPNRGMEPQSAGDPGGWLQQSLFFVICGGIVVIGLLAWRSSRAARARRSAAGLDPASVARAHGTGVRGGGSGPPEDPK